MSERAVSWFLAAASRGLLLRDRISGRMQERLDTFPFEAERITLLSGERRLAAVWVSAGEDAPAILICHGIGERVEYWGEVQAMLRGMGISSFVFNYTGFGASEGEIRVRHCEEDAVAAFAELRRRSSGAIFLLGYSMGSAVVSTVASRVRADGVIVCEGFPSLHAAARAARVPRWLALRADGIWHTAEHLAALRTPVLIVHSDADRLFPLAMAEELVQACGGAGEQCIVHGLDHNDPIFAATEAYWRPVAAWVKRQRAMEEERR